MAWNSKIKVFGMPLFSFGFAAHGFFAVGFSGVGVITIAQFGVGIINITQFGAGIIGISQFQLGFFTMAQMGIGIILAYGQGVLGFIAIGDGAIGYYAHPDTFYLLKSLEATWREILVNPFPFSLWSCFWFAILAFLTIRRDTITSPMTFLDLFRRKIKHSNALIRLKALGEISNQPKLADIIREDASLKIKKAALSKIYSLTYLKEFASFGNPVPIRVAAIQKIEDQGFLASLAEKEQQKNIINTLLSKITDTELLYQLIVNAKVQLTKVVAIHKLENYDEKRLAKLAIAEQNLGVFNAMAKKIEDDNLLKNIIENSTSKQISQSAFNNLSNIDDDYLLSIALDKTKGHIADDAIGLIGNSEYLKRIVNADVHPFVKVSAIGLIDDKDFLVNIKNNEKFSMILDAVEKQLNAISPLYYSLKLELDCPYCSQPVFLNGPIRKTSCNSCLSDIKVNNKFWKNVAKASFGKTSINSFNLVLEKSGRIPRCNECNAQIDTDNIPAGSKKPVICKNCGAKNATFPVPSWLPWSKFSDQIFCAEEEGVSDEESKKAVKPVSISCIKCGAPLEITVDTPRNATCHYCHTVQYLPDQLWLSLHPVKIKQSWYIRCSYKEKNNYRKLAGK